MSDSHRPDTVHLGRENLPSDAAPILAEGFIPLFELAGEDWLGPVWPATYSRYLDASYEDNWNDLSVDHYVWFVKSPWPDRTAEEVVDDLWGHVYTDPGYSGPVGDSQRQAERARAQHFFRAKY